MLLGRGRFTFLAGVAIIPIALSTLGTFAARAAPTPHSELAEPAEFWFVEANEGQSAGGHAALRIGPRVYHLEHRGDGLIADRRTSPARFREIYAERGNRQIEAIHLALTPKEKQTLKRALATRFSARSRRLGALDALEDELRWLREIERSGAIEVEVPGLGLFADSATGSVCDRRSANAALASRLDALRATARSERERLTAALTRSPERPNPTRNEAALPGGRMRQLIHAVQKEVALKRIVGCDGVLRKGALIATETLLDAGPSDESPRDRDAWRLAEAALTARIGALLESPREDTGLPLLLTWARVLAARETLATGRVHVLSVFKESHDAARLPLAASSNSVEGELPEGWQERALELARARWQDARSRFNAADGPLEARMLGLERAHHRLRHLRAQTLHNPVRPESRSPSHAEGYAAARRTLPWPSRISLADVLSTRIAREEEAERLREIRAEELSYDLFARNCVTELRSLLATLQPAPAETEAGANLATRRETGVQAGSKAGGARLNRLSPMEILQGDFIPELVAARIENAFSDQPRRILPSARDRARTQARTATSSTFGKLALDAREFATFTSRTYAANQDDSRFVFFSDGPPAIRPLIGLANFTYGAAGALVGVLEAPFDRGVGLRRGIQGMIMSVPELFFFQVRQGSYRILPPVSGATPSPSAASKAESTETR
ncbi:MAG: hypothetical protein AB8G23_18800 [Myxococcota bacterium]